MQILNDRDRAILKLAQVAAEGNCLYEVAPNKLLNTMALNETWWNGIILTPSRDRLGLVPSIVLEGDTFLFFSINNNEFKLNSTLFHLDNRNRGCAKLYVQPSISFDSSSETETSDNYKSNKLLKQFSTTSSDGCESDYSSPRPVKPRLRPQQK